MQQLNTWILIVGTELFASEDLIFWKCVRTATRHLVEAVDSAGGEGLRTSCWNGYDLTTRRGRERLYQFCSTKRPRHVWFSSPCRVSGASSQRVSRILDGTAAVVPRVQLLGCHVHFAQPLSVSSWRQNALLGMSEKMMKAVVNGCAWGLRDSRGSLLNRSLASFDHIFRRAASVESSNLRQETQTRQTLRFLQWIIVTVSTIPVSDVDETVSCERQLALRFAS